MAEATVIRRQISRLLNSLSILQGEHNAMTIEFKVVFQDLKSDFLALLPTDQEEKWRRTFNHMEQELLDCDFIVDEKTSTIMNRLEEQFPKQENSLANLNILTELGFCVTQLKSLKADYDIQNVRVGSALTTVEEDEREAGTTLPFRLGKMLRFTICCFQHSFKVNILGLIKHAEAIMVHTNRAISTTTTTDQANHATTPTTLTDKK